MSQQGGREMTNVTNIIKVNVRSFFSGSENRLFITAAST